MRAADRNRVRSIAIARKTSSLTGSVLARKYSATVIRRTWPSPDAPSPG
jgi:hypothetical protein